LLVVIRNPMFVMAQSTISHSQTEMHIFPMSVSVYGM
jgi:hypothetical protein